MESDCDIVIVMEDNKVVGSDIYVVNVVKEEEQVEIEHGVVTLQRRSRRKMRRKRLILLLL